jgi:hypothetical protein
MTYFFSLDDVRSNRALVQRTHTHWRHKAQRRDPNDAYRRLPRYLYIYIYVVFLINKCSLLLFNSYLYTSTTKHAPLQQPTHTYEDKAWIRAQSTIYLQGFWAPRYIIFMSLSLFSSSNQFVLLFFCVLPVLYETCTSQPLTHRRGWVMEKGTIDVV